MSDLLLIDGPHLHLALNHIPVVGMPLLLLLSIVAWIMKNRTLQLTSYYGVILVCVMVLPAIETGEMAQDKIEQLRPAAESLIEVHEETAEKVVWLAVLSGVLAFVGILFSLRGRGISKSIYLAMMVSLMLTSIGFGWVANLGGQISHPEIRGSNNAIQKEFLKNDSVGINGHEAN